MQVCERHTEWHDRGNASGAYLSLLSAGSCRRTCKGGDKSQPGFDKVMWYSSESTAYSREVLQTCHTQPF